MYFRMIFIRLFPMAILKLCRDRKTIKIISSLTVVLWLLLFLTASGEIFRQRGFPGIFYLLAAMLPHAPLYLFALWILLRCIWREWSQRVWRRIYLVANVCMVCGVLMEIYWNPMILHIFSKIFPSFF